MCMKSPRNNSAAAGGVETRSGFRSSRTRLAVQHQRAAEEKGILAKVSPGSSPIRRGGQRSGQDNNNANVNNNNNGSAGYATKVKKLVRYQDGLLESVLLPILVTSSVMKLKKVTVSSSLEGVPVVFGDYDNDVKLEEAIEEEEHLDYGGSSGEDDDVSGSWTRQRGLQVIQQQRKAIKQEKGEGGGVAEAFIAALLHALSCKSCDISSCQKMRLVLGHFFSCKKDHEDCQLCQQLLAAIAGHAQGCNQSDCPVPLCLALRNAEDDDAADIEPGNPASAGIGLRSRSVVLVGGVNSKSNVGNFFI